MYKKIEIQDYSAEGFINKLSDDLALSPDKEEREYCVNLANIYGHGYIKTYDFDHGLTAYEFDCTLEQGLLLFCKKDLVQPLMLVFNREDSIFHYFEGEKQQEIHRLESLMVCGGIQKIQTLKLSPKVPTCFLVLLINRKEFEKKIKEFLPSLSNNLEPIFRDINGINPFQNQGHYSLDIAKFIEEFTTTEETGFMKHVFLEGKFYEILTHFFKQYDDDHKKDGHKILRQNTVEQIEKASDIIESELEALGSILSIATRVGLNQNTLQLGFKQLYGKSVNQYIKDIRLEKAKDLMENSDLNITEITYKLGINSRSYFSKLFKDRFGVTPKSYMSLRRKGSNSNLTG